MLLLHYIENQLENYNLVSLNFDHSMLLFIELELTGNPGAPEGPMSPAVPGGPLSPGRPPIPAGPSLP